MNNLICIAKITKPHGVKGHANIISYCQVPENLFKYSTLYDFQGNQVKLELYGRKGELFIVSFSPRIDRNQVEKLAGSNLYITKDMLPTLLEGEYYNNELEGLEVLNLEMQNLGIIIAIHNFGAGDIIELKHTDKKDSFFLPFSKEFVKEIDLHKRRLFYLT